MGLSNWLELASLLLIGAGGSALWWLVRRRLRSNDGFEGIAKGKGKLPARRKLDVEEEIERLESILGRK